MCGRLNVIYCQNVSQHTQNNPFVDHYKNVKKHFDFAENVQLCIRIKVKFNSIKVVLSQLKQELMSLSIHIHLLLAASKTLTAEEPPGAKKKKSHWLVSAIWGKWICNSQAV